MLFRVPQPSQLDSGKAIETSNHFINGNRQFPIVFVAEEKGAGFPPLPEGRGLQSED